jgi:hypothetical protein
MSGRVQADNHACDIVQVAVPGSEKRRYGATGHPVVPTEALVAYVIL